MPSGDNIDVQLRVSSDYDHARRKAFWNRLLNHFSGKRSRLVSFDDVRQNLNIRGQWYAGVHTVPIDKIVGSVGRYRDFDASFLPIQEKNKGRWKGIDSTYYTGKALPAVQLYRIGSVYFVIDGNHRISVAREQGVEFIDAEVYELDIGVPFDLGNDEPREAILEAEYQQFLQETHLDRLRPDHEIRFSTHGRYARLLHHIEVHRYYMGLERRGDVSREEAVTSWYDTLYLPIALLIRSSHILRQFPERTEGDLYVWIMNHRHFLSEVAGHDVGPEKAASDFARRFGAVRRVGWSLKRLFQRNRGEKP